MAPPNPSRTPRSRTTLARLKAALDEHVEFPSVYVFKFIVPRGEANHLLALLDGMPVTTRQSSAGRYVSVTCETEMPSSASIIAVYERTAVVPGLMSL